MEPDEQRIVHALRAVAAEAGPLRLRVGELDRIRRLRRARHRFVVYTSVAAAIVGCAVVGSSVAIGLGREGPTKPTTRTLASTAQADLVRGPLRIACGEPLPVRPTSAPFDGTEVAITKVTYPSTDGPPEVSYRLRFAVATTRRAGHVEPQVLILRDDVVVGGPRP